jgi:hypothetical protein
MRKAGTVVLLVGLSAVLVGTMWGCSPWRSTLDTTAERDGRLLQGGDLQMRMMLDDFDRFMLIDRSSRLSPWYARVGT